MNSGRVAGDVLLRSILASTTDDGVASNALLREFHRGYPVVNLRRLLVSGRDIPIGAGAFISAELGESAKEVLDDVAALASHPSPRVRGDVIGAITRAQRVATPSAIAVAVQGIIDEHEGVRWKAALLVDQRTEYPQRLPDPPSTRKALSRAEMVAGSGLRRSGR